MGVGERGRKEGEHDPRRTPPVSPKSARRAIKGKYVLYCTNIEASDRCLWTRFSSHVFHVSFDDSMTIRT